MTQVTLKRAVSLYVLLHNVDLDDRESYSMVLSPRKRDDTYGGLNQPAVHGGLEGDETYQEALFREIEEELGEAVAQLVRLQDHDLQIANIDENISGGKKREVLSFWITLDRDEFQEAYTPTGENEPVVYVDLNHKLLTPLGSEDLKVMKTTGVPVDSNFYMREDEVEVARQVWQDGCTYDQTGF